MRILIIGASGFIGGEITSTLLQAGHEIVAAVRAQAAPPLPGVTDIVYCDFNRDTSAAVWLPRLKNIDAVINCVGILQSTGKQSIQTIHELTPKALFAACVEAKVKKVIHISALGADKNIDTPYMHTKKAAEDYLRSLTIDWIILRPSFVYGKGSYGGSSLFRALAALPFFLPVIAGGQQKFQPIFLDDLAKAMLRLLENDAISKQIFTAVGPEQVSFTRLLALIRQWLKFGKAKIISAPLWWMKVVAKIGDWLNIGAISSATLRMLLVDNVATTEELQKFSQAIGFTPRTFSEVMQTTPSYVQDRWHARLYFLRPALRISVGILWLWSGIASLIPPLTNHIAPLMQIGFSPSLAPALLFAAAFWDIGLGAGTLANWRLTRVAALQIITIIFYTLIATLTLPDLWLQPFAPLAKNIPILIATLVMLAIAKER